MGGSGLVISDVTGTLEISEGNDNGRRMVDLYVE